jgi:HrpA-like RNA helicase
MELCLHTKLLAPPNTPIADFLSRTPQPPSFMVTRNAVQMLKTMEALDAWEDVTELGSHLLDMPVEPRLGKMVLYAVVLKCLDPILTIVCCISYRCVLHLTFAKNSLSLYVFSAFFSRDPFLLPINPALKKAAKKSRSMFSGGSYSDHMALLRAFQSWQRERANGTERAFCSRYQVTPNMMYDRLHEFNIPYMLLDFLVDDGDDYRHEEPGARFTNCSTLFFN